MKLYIQNFCCISPAGVYVHEMNISQLTPANGSRPSTQEPDYTTLIAPMQLRRMSKPVRIGMAAARLCLQENTEPQSIHVGTAYGNLSDSEIFLKKIIDQEEQMLTPTAFIQSTHNTVSGQIALALDCTQHNMTFVHRAHSLESAWLDATLQQTKTTFGQYALVGAVDECTDIAYQTLDHFHVYSPDTAAGEGAAFFQVTADPHSNHKAVVNDLYAFHSHDKEEVIRTLAGFMQRQEHMVSSADVVLYGAAPTEAYKELLQQLFPGNKNFRFKAFCGEYPTAVGFALSMAIALLTEHPNCWILNNTGSYWSIWHLGRH